MDDKGVERETDSDTTHYVYVSKKRLASKSCVKAPLKGVN